MQQTFELIHLNEEHEAQPSKKLNIEILSQPTDTTGLSVTIRNQTGDIADLYIEYHNDRLKIYLWDQDDQGNDPTYTLSQKVSTQ